MTARQRSRLRARARAVLGLIVGVLALAGCQQQETWSFGGPESAGSGVAQSQPGGEASVPERPSPEADVSETADDAGFPGEAGLVTHSGSGTFCVYAEDRLDCAAGHGATASLPRTGAPNLNPRAPRPVDHPEAETHVLVPGQSADLGPFTCEATHDGFDCESDASGATVQVSGEHTSFTPPTR